MRKYTRDPLLDLPRAGPKECANLFGWQSAATFKRHLSDLPPIRSVNLVNGRYYILEDLLKARHPGVSQKEIDIKLAAYLEGRKAQRSDSKHIEWIGAKEAAGILGFVSGKTWKNHLPKLPAVKAKKTARGTMYSLEAVFRAVYVRATEEQLWELIIEHKKNRAEKRLRRRNKNEYSEKD